MDSNFGTFFSFTLKLLQQSQMQPLEYKNSISWLKAKGTLRVFTHYFRSGLFSLHFSCSTHFGVHFDSSDDPTLDLGQNLACAYPDYKCTTRIENYGKFPIIWYVVCLYWRQIRFKKWHLNVGAYGRVPHRHRKISTRQIA